MRQTITINIINTIKLINNYIFNLNINMASFNNLNPKFSSLLSEEWKERVKSFKQLSYEVVFEKDVIVSIFHTLSPSKTHYIFVFRQSNNNVSLIIYLQEGSRFTLNESIGKVNKKLIDKFEMRVNTRFALDLVK